MDESKTRWKTWVGRWIEAVVLRPRTRSVPGIAGRGDFKKVTGFVREEHNCLRIVRMRACVSVGAGGGRWVFSIQVLQRRK